MDRTLNHAKRRNKHRRARNRKAWQFFSPDGKTCRFCPHTIADHLTSSAQPHFYRPATEAERRDPYEKLYHHYPVSNTGQVVPGTDSVLVKRVIIANRAELLTAFCKTCAADKDTAQVLCYQRTLAKGEVVGFKNLNVNNHPKEGR